MTTLHNKHYVNKERGVIMETETIDKLYLELSHVTKARNFREIDLLDTLWKVYRKHHLQEDFIGWDELSTLLCDTLCRTIGESAFSDEVERLREP